ncbi:hypothetical protein [Methylobacterium gregans]|uniref:Uncharacterized protein n=1 Tax=Methylobacterium gregans TaxID=374424 RepID=A0AA37HQM3_9HYPH|nr:hypothetical protein [Methylobacterium gregans]MDQ0519238.1 hypothetical protein [Methylobacterium gregans]GJD80035.1 hypothetical protein NBEOAGPD_3267 [Methylobacterium gregans]GLS53123.1 hypothetical protein GCM10007886_13060 [Methylobacterium gregans]
MRDLDRALADIVAIRSQLARDEAFRGLGAATVAATGFVALMVAGAQTLWLGDPNARPLLFFAIWVGAALVAFTLVGIETVRRSRRIHSGLADAMIWNAIEVFLPTAGAGACLGLVIGRFAPEAAWMLPGLWQVLTGLGLFASARILPRSVQSVAAWYLLAGLGGLALASTSHALSPWLMGLPFFLGQGSLALILHRATRGDDAAR